MKETKIGIRERTRRAVRADLVETAMGLFLLQGYEETTVEQIADAAGMSRRTFFRYFSSKGDVLAQAFASVGAKIAGRLASRPEDEPHWVALHRSFDTLVEQIQADERALPLTRLMLESPALQSSHQEKQDSWRKAISDVLYDRLDTTTDDRDRRLQAEALSTAALGCLAAAQAEWVNQNGEVSLEKLLNLSMKAVNS